jgi:hypothetical protein
MQLGAGILNNSIDPENREGKGYLYSVYNKDLIVQLLYNIGIDYYPSSMNKFFIRLSFPMYYNLTDTNS